LPGAPSSDVPAEHLELPEAHAVQLPGQGGVLLAEVIDEEPPHGLDEADMRQQPAGRFLQQPHLLRGQAVPSPPPLWPPEKRRQGNAAPGGPVAVNTIFS
jgi:hypothetical protein